MKNSTLENRIIFSDMRPSMLKEAEITAGTLIDTVRSFGEKYLDGIAILRLQEMSPLGTVKVCFESLAYALKLTIRAFAVTEPVEIDLRVLEDEFVISIFLPEEPSIALGGELANAFRRAGFTTKSFGFCLAFSTPFKATKQISLRAPSKAAYMLLLEKIFFG